jgi:hypothetical protein
MRINNFVLAFVVFFISCKSNSDSTGRDALSVSKQGSIIIAEEGVKNKYLIDSMSIGEYSLCDNIDSLIRKNSNYSKKIFEDEDQKWLGYYFKTEDSKWVLVESRGESSKLISRITTNSKSYALSNGIKCGMSVTSFLNKKIEFNFIVELGVFSIYIPSNSISLVVKKAFDNIENINKIERGELSQEEIIALLNKNAIIDEIILVGPCI